MTSTKTSDRSRRSFGTDMTPAEPAPDCSLCPRLVDFRTENRAQYPDFFNGAVPSFGPDTARLLIVGLAPGLKGANQTGRPFTGDYAGDLLYATLTKFGFAQGTYAARPDDGLSLTDCMVTNAVRCVPPQNKPIGSEINQCRAFLTARIGSLPRLSALVALGRIAHDAVLRSHGHRISAFKFGHGAAHDLGGVTLFDSYHCSRYNTNTRRLTPEMFEAVFAQVRRHLDA
ncbi:MAG: uracil-DNA glycosylase [Hyphomicrobiales bacterium]